MSSISRRKILLVLFITGIILPLNPLGRSLGPAMADSTEPELSLSGVHYFENTRKGSMWIKERSRKINSAEDAQKYLAQLNEGDFSDWRFPTKHELHDLFLIFDMKNNGEVKIRIEGKYWLVNDDGKLEVGAWEIGSGCGPERNFHSGKRGHVMAVRP